MALRFFFDECVDEDIATALCAHGIDVKTTTDLGRKGLSDAEQLDFATSENRAIYSIDQDFLILAHRDLEAGQPFAGVVYHRPGQCSKRQIIEALLLMNAVYTAEDMQNHIEFI